MSQTNEQRYREALEEQKRWLDAIWAVFTAIKVGYGDDELGPEEAKEAQCEAGQDQCAKAIKAIKEALAEPTATITPKDECQFIMSNGQKCEYGNEWIEGHQEAHGHPFVPPITACPKCGGSGFSGLEEETFRGYIKEYCLVCLGTGRAPQPAKSAEGERCAYVYGYTKAVCGLPENDREHSPESDGHHAFVAPGPAPEGRVIPSEIPGLNIRRGDEL